MKYFDVFCAHAQNGSEATRLLRAGGFKNLVIGVTGNVMEEDVRQYLAAGADMVVAKPMRMPTLSSILRHAQVGALCPTPFQRRIPPAMGLSHFVCVCVCVCVYVCVRIAGPSLAGRSG